MDKLSYALAMGIGQQLKQMGLSGRLVTEDFAQGISDMLNGNTPLLKHSEAQRIVQDFFREQEKAGQAAKEAAGKQALAEGKVFLANNRQRASVTETKSGLQYEVLAEGKGRHPRATDRVRCHYEGRLLNGTVFDSSYKRGEPAVFGLSQVIPGWTEGVQLMGEGAKFRFYIPYMLAYGESGAGADIPPFATLIFDVELLEIL